MKFDELVNLCESSNNVIKQYWDKKHTKLKKEIWYNSNKVIHRVGAPAHQIYYSNGKKQIEGWFDNGIYNRLDGPAVIEYSKDGKITYQRYFIKGIPYTKEQFDKYTKDMNKDQLDMLSDLGQTFE